MLVSVFASLIVLSDDRHSYDELALVCSTFPDKNVVMDKSIHKVDAFPTDYLRNPDPSCTDPKLIWDFYKGGYDGKLESRRPVSVVKKKYAPIATSFSSSDDNFKCRVKKSKKKRTNLDHGVELASTIDCFNHSMDDISNGSSNVSHNYDGRSSDDTPSSSTNGIFDREAGRKQRKKQRRNKSVKRRLMRENIQAVADATYAALASTINNRSSGNNNYNKNNTSEGKKHDRGRINLSRMLSPDQCNDRDPKETRMTNTKSSSSTRTSKQGHGQGPYPPISVWSYGCSILSQQDTEFGLNCDEDKLISDYTSLQVSRGSQIVHMFLIFLLLTLVFSVVGSIKQ